MRISIGKSRLTIARAGGGMLRIVAVGPEGGRLRFGHVRSYRRVILRVPKPIRLGPRARRSTAPESPDPASATIERLAHGAARITIPGDPYRGKGPARQTSFAVAGVAIGASLSGESSKSKERCCKGRRRFVM